MGSKGKGGSGSGSESGDSVASTGLGFRSRPGVSEGASSGNPAPDKKLRVSAPTPDSKATGHGKEPPANPLVDAASQCEHRSTDQFQCECKYLLDCNATVRDVLRAAKEKLANVQGELSSSQEKLANVQCELSSSQEKLASAAEKIVQLESELLEERKASGASATTLVLVQGGHGPGG